MTCSAGASRGSAAIRHQQLRLRQLVAQPPSPPHPGGLSKPAWQELAPWGVSLWSWDCLSAPKHCLTGQHHGTVPAVMPVHPLRGGYPPSVTLSHCSKTFGGTSSKGGPPQLTRTLTSSGNSRQQQDKDEKEMKKMVGRARGGFPSRNAARKPDGTCCGTLSSASHVGHPKPWSNRLPLPAGAKARVPGCLLEVQSQEHSPGLDLRSISQSLFRHSKETNWVCGSMTFLEKQNRQRLPI